MYATLWILGTLTLAAFAAFLASSTLGLVAANKSAKCFSGWLNKLSSELLKLENRPAEEAILFAQTHLSSEPRFLDHHPLGLYGDIKKEKALHLGCLEVPINIIAFINERGSVDGIHIFGFESLDGLFLGSSDDIWFVSYDLPTWMRFGMKPANSNAALCSIVGPKVKEHLLKLQGFELLPTDKTA